MGAARMEDDQQFCLRWNNHQSTLVSVFDNLLEKGIHVDCTLAAEGKTLNAHKVVLSACSPYFENVLTQQYDKHPIIILKDVKWAELRAMMDYMYRGEVNISQDQLAALLKAAESLQIKGLSDNKPSRPPSHPAPPAPVPVPVPLQPMPQPPHVSSPAPQMMEGSIGSREGSISPSRKKKKRRNSAEVSASLTPVPQQPQPTPNDVPMTDDTLPQLKEENTRDGVEDLTIDEENDEPPATSHNDLVRNFAWHLDRSQDELGTDGGRDSQDLRKDSHISSALLSLLSVQHAHAQAQAVPAVPPSCIQVTNLMKHTRALAKDLPIPPPVHLTKLPYPNALDAYPDTIKAQILHQTFAPNNNNLHAEPKKGDEMDSDVEYDDTDDIVLPEEEGFYCADNMKPMPGLNDIKNFGENAIGVKQEREGGRERERGRGGEDRQFECRHCGKRYRWKSTLRRHENVECGGKAPSHQCPYCAYKAKQRGNLGVHIRKHHDAEWFLFANRARKSSKRSSAEPSVEHSIEHSARAGSLSLDSASP